jgi:hypothetical protein
MESQDVDLALTGGNDSDVAIRVEAGGGGASPRLSAPPSMSGAAVPIEPAAIRLKRETATSLKKSSVGTQGTNPPTAPGLKLRKVRAADDP